MLMHITLKCRFLHLSGLCFLYLVPRWERYMHTWEDFVSCEHYLCSCHHTPCCSLLMGLDITPATVSFAVCEICWFPERLGRLCKPTVLPVVLWPLLLWELGRGWVTFSSASAGARVWACDCLVQESSSCAEIHVISEIDSNTQAVELFHAEISMEYLDITRESF